MKNRNTKGFTLVEIIVVLVIIAILAATTLPALVGYIDRARDKVAMDEARTCMVAAQAIASELYGMGFKDTVVTDYITQGKRGSGATKIPTTFTKTIASLVNNDKYNDVNKIIKQLVYDDTGTILIFEFYSTNGRSVIYVDGTMHMGTYIPPKT